MENVILFTMTFLIIVLLQDPCNGASLKKQVAREVQKKVRTLENRLMTSISDTCHKQICTSGNHLYVDHSL